MPIRKTPQAQAAINVELLQETTEALRDATNLLRDIQVALGTKETGPQLVEVARNAHHAELAAAAEPKDPPALEHIANVMENFLNLVEPLFKRNEDGYMEMELMQMRAMKAAIRDPAWVRTTTPE